MGVHMHSRPSVIIVIHALVNTVLIPAVPLHLAPQICRLHTSLQRHLQLNILRVRRYLRRRILRHEIALRRLRRYYHRLLLIAA